MTITISKAQHLLSSRANDLICNQYIERPDEHNDYHASSTYLDLGQQVSPNNIAYYISGDEFACSDFKLVLNVNYLPDATPSTEFFIACASDICGKVADLSLPEDVESFIRDASIESNAYTYCYNGITIKVNKQAWLHSVNNGYEIHFIFSKTK